MIYSREIFLPAAQRAQIESWMNSCSCEGLLCVNPAPDSSWDGEGTILILPFSCRLARALLNPTPSLEPTFNVHARNSGEEQIVSKDPAATGESSWALLQGAGGAVLTCPWWSEPPWITKPKRSGAQNLGKRWEPQTAKLTRGSDSPGKVQGAKEENSRYKPRNKWQPKI